MSLIDTNKADIVDTSHVDEALASARRNEETARRRATVLTWGKAVLLGGLGVAAVLFAASLFIQPKVIETTKVVEKPVIVEKQVVVERDAKPKPVAPSAPAKPAPLPPPQPAPTTETHPWDKLAGKQYAGIITDVIDGAVCLDHDMAPQHCVHLVKTDANGHAVLHPDGSPVFAPDADLSPMSKWIGYSAYKANRPEDPAHLADYWVADNGELIKFEQAPKGHADSVTLRSDGQSLLVDVGIGGHAYPFVLDTGASAMTVTQDLADRLIRAHYATQGPPEDVVLADGSSHIVPTVVIDAVTVGTHRVGNVHAQVTPAGAPMLLGLGVLNSIGRFEIDAPHRTLTFNEAAS